MRYEKNKDLGWVITFASLLVFLLAAIISSATKSMPASVPEAIALANPHLGPAFVSAVASFIRYAALASLLYGIIGVIIWPPGGG